MSQPRTLILTLPPFQGGVAHTARQVALFLESRGHAVSLAYYATFHHAAAIITPSWRAVLGARPGTRRETVFGRFPGTAVGCWLPELEFSYYRPSARWRGIIRDHDYHVAVGGTVMVSYPLTHAGIPHLIWCASTLEHDRDERRATWRWPRRLLERTLVDPVQKRMERRILEGPGHLMATSRDSAAQLAALGNASSQIALVPIPVDTDEFRPPDAEAPCGVVGFAGRLDDPRKNLALLMEAMTLVAHSRPDARLVLAGDGEGARRLAEAMGIARVTTFLGHVSPGALSDFYNSLDMFVIPSRREGFGIVGIEAMASGVPVIATRCGGPEDFVEDGVNGFLTRHRADDIAERIVLLMEDRDRRARMAAAARQTVLSRYSVDVFGQRISHAWSALWRRVP